MDLGVSVICLNPDYAFYLYDFRQVSLTSSHLASHFFKKIKDGAHLKECFLRIT